jgi:hypothetical protein
MPVYVVYICHMPLTVYAEGPSAGPGLPASLGGPPGDWGPVNLTLKARALAWRIMHRPAAGQSEPGPQTGLDVQTHITLTTTTAATSIVGRGGTNPAAAPACGPLWLMHNTS